MLKKTHSLVRFLHQKCVVAPIDCGVPLIECVKGLQREYTQLEKLAPCQAHRVRKSVVPRNLL